MTTRRCFTACLGLLFPLCAQEPPATGTPATPRAIYQMRFSTWSALNASLAKRLAVLNPCDPDVKKSIDEVKASSEFRLQAWVSYLRDALSPNTEGDASHLVAALTAAQAEMQAERDYLLSEIQIEGNALGALTNTPDSTQTQADLRKLIDFHRQRATSNAEQLKSTQEMISALSTPVSSAERAKLLAKELELAQSEGELWRLNYEAVSLQSQTACVIGYRPGPQTKKSAPARRTP